MRSFLWPKPMQKQKSVRIIKRAFREQKSQTPNWLRERYFLESRELAYDQAELAPL
jgi:hypothetical protein